jgi:hypothetical protein
MIGLTGVESLIPPARAVGCGPSCPKRGFTFVCGGSKVLCKLENFLNTFNFNDINNLMRLGQT